MSKHDIKITDRFNFPKGETYLGFDKKSEYYYRDDSFVVFNRGSLVMALTDVDAFKIYDHAELVSSEFSPLIDSNDFNALTSYGYSNFLIAYCDAFRALSSLHAALGDLLIAPFLKPFMNEGIDLAYREAKKLNPDVILDSELIKTIINKEVFNGDVKYKNFNIAGIWRVFDNEHLAASTALLFFADSLNQQFCKVFKQLTVLNKCFSYLVPEILERQEEDPILRYVRKLDVPSVYNHVSDGTTNALPNSSGYIDAISKLNKELIKPGSSIKRIMYDESADIYDTTRGFRLISFYDTNDLINTGYAEFEFLCLNNIEVIKCKNCGRYFFPASMLSSFCDRLLKDGSGRTCKSISSQWYIESRRITDPANEEYVLYRKRYRARAMRNKIRNPYSRFEKWNQQARALLKECEDGKISIEEFSKTLAEMDKDMKPLDKM